MSEDELRTEAGRHLVAAFREMAEYRLPGEQHVNIPSGVAAILAIEAEAAALATPAPAGLEQRLTDCEDALAMVEAAYDRDDAIPAPAGLEPEP